MTPPPRSTLSPETVLAVDNVPLELPIARVGSRVLAAVADYLVLTLVTISSGLAFLAVGVALSLKPGWIMGLMLVGYFLLEHGYFMGQEILLDGQTLGKRLFRLQVVSADGSRASPSALVVRNLLRTLDLLVGVVLMALDPLARRVGDRLAGTRVVHRARLESPAEEWSFPADWEPEEIRLVEEFFVRLGELDPDRRGRLADRLEEYVRARSPEILPPSGDWRPEERLQMAFTPGGS
ncbi:MAG: RDD family protein [Thermoanaerobaculia bacterium]|nr:RDD family protein [Thermoanaerobaculia bacterium]